MPESSDTFLLGRQVRDVRTCRRHGLHKKDAATQETPISTSNLGNLQALSYIFMITLKGFEVQRLFLWHFVRQCREAVRAQLPCPPYQGGEGRGAVRAPTGVRKKFAIYA